MNPCLVLFLGCQKVGVYKVKFLVSCSVPKLTPEMAVDSHACHVHLLQILDLHNRDY